MGFGGLIGLLSETIYIQRQVNTHAFGRTITYWLQVIFGGSGSNKTLTHIINQSMLIETYRNIHINIKKYFYIRQKSTQHAVAKMAFMLQAIQNRIRERHPTASVETLNVFLKGAQMYVGGDDINEEGDEDEDDGNGDQGQENLRGMGLMLSDLDAL